MHHSLDKLAGVRLRADLNYVPPRCSFCTAWAMDWCSLCSRPFCEADFVADGLCRECEAEIVS